MATALMREQERARWAARRPGYYWVRTNDVGPWEWRIAEWIAGPDWMDNRWQMAGEATRFTDRGFCLIGARIEEPPPLPDEECLLCVGTGRRHTCGFVCVDYECDCVTRKRRRGVPARV